MSLPERSHSCSSIDSVQYYYYWQDDTCQPNGNEAIMILLTCDQPNYYCEEGYGLYEDSITASTLETYWKANASWLIEGGPAIAKRLKPIWTKK